MEMCICTCGSNLVTKFQYGSKIYISGIVRPFVMYLYFFILSKASGDKCILIFLIIEKLKYIDFIYDNSLSLFTLHKYL